MLMLDYIGLLAGLDEFPSVILPEASASSHMAGSTDYLNELLDLPHDFSLESAKEYPNLTVLKVADLGSVRHIYSHINATFHCYHLKLSSCKPPRIKTSTSRCRFVDRPQIANANISTGAVKIWELVSGNDPKKKAKKNKAPTESPKGNIKQFLAPKKQSPEEPTADTKIIGTITRKRKLIIVESDSD